MILVTGAGGFIGQHVCQLLSAQGQSVLGVDRSFRPHLSFPRVQGDLTNNEFLSGLFREYTFDAVIHLAALLNTASRQQPGEAMRVNIGCSLNLLHLVQQFNIPKFIYGSSISVYGARPYTDYGEVSEVELASPSNVYGISKRFVEVVGEDLRRQEKTQFIALRISMVVGTGASSPASPWRNAIFEKLNSPLHTVISLPFAPYERLPLVHVADVAEMIKRLIDVKRAAHAIYNTPSENWLCSDLAGAIQALNQNVLLAFGPTSTRGDPEAIDGSRFAEEFSFHTVPLRERLQRIIADCD